MTIQKQVVRLDESKIVVVRKVPMTCDTSDKLRAIRRDMEEKYYMEKGVDVELPYPVVIDEIINFYFLNNGSAKQCQPKE